MAALTRKGMVARRYMVSGRVQGVGYRYFAQRSARECGVAGFARNLENGDVEVHAQGTAGQLSEFEGYLWKGPPASDVRGVERKESAMLNLEGFKIL